ncbi:MAG TPA: glucose-1-phosphate cytidylyltransferase [Xanthobacteraceae bacterium]|nr:glucose-1-phosphate cytidylyltransferase [Xanthobacteraceae bacterium]
MKVVILCGGQGTRIRGINDDLPKPMIPIGGYPILWHIMRGYAAAGYKDFVLCLGHKGRAIKDFFLNYHTSVADFVIDFAEGGKIAIERPRDIDWRVTLAETGERTLTGSRVKRIERYIDGDTFLLTYGDGVSDIDIPALVAFHRRHKPVVTVSGVRPPGRFGEIEHNGERVSEFNEKPQASGGRISGGFFVCDRRLFDYLDAEREDEVLEAEVLQTIAREGQMAMYAHDGFWQCMDTYRDYTLLNEIYEKGRAPWKVW